MQNRISAMRDKSALTVASVAKAIIVIRATRNDASASKAESNTMNATQYLESLLSQIDARAQYEIEKNSENTSIQACLVTSRTSIRNSVNHEKIAEILMLSNHDVATINRQERSNNRYNVYAYEKIANIANVLLNSTSVSRLNHYSTAILKAVHSYESAELTFTHKDAVSACSADCKHSEKAREKILKDVRYAKHVAATTASTQSSSSINALQSMNVLTEARDDANNVIYKLNRESFATKALAEKLALAL